MGAGVTLTLALSIAAVAFGQEPIRLKTRALRTGETFERPALAAARRSAHYIIQFAEFPGVETRRELARREIRVLDYVPEFGLMVSSAPDADLGGLGVRFTSPLPPADKISPALSNRNSAAYLLVFHADVDAEAARALAVQSGFVIHEAPGLLPGHLVASGGWRGIGELAAADEVAYILPARADLAFGKGVKGCPGAFTEAGLVGEYATVGPGWAADAGGGVTLKYAVESPLPALDAAAARAEFQRAMREWSKYANVTFSESNTPSGARTVAIRFASRAHGDSAPFDGRGGALGHTYYPAPPNTEPIAGDMHLDADEDWRIGADTDLYSVALHELGHALGLGHSDDPDSVMYPYYRLASGLTGDDVAAIRRLYSAPGVTPLPDQPREAGDPATPTTPPGDAAPPRLRIGNPAGTLVSTSSSSISISGTATDPAGVAAVRWTTSGGYSGVAQGTASWRATAPLLIGTNLIRITATDSSGNLSWRSITVVRR